MVFAYFSDDMKLQSQCYNIFFSNKKGISLQFACTLHTPYIIFYSAKGGLISEDIFALVPSSKNLTNPDKSASSSETVKDRDLALFFEDGTNSKIPSNIKPPLQIAWVDNHLQKEGKKVVSLLPLL